MMKEIFVRPEMKISKFAVESVVTGSGELPKPQQQTAMEKAQAKYKFQDTQVILAW